MGGPHVTSLITSNLMSTRLPFSLDVGVMTTRPAHGYPVLRGGINGGTAATATTKVLIFHVTQWSNCSIWGLLPPYF